MYIETVKKLYLTPGELTLLKNCYELVEKMISDNKEEDLDGISWGELCTVSEGLLLIHDIAEIE